MRYRSSFAIIVILAFLAEGHAQSRPTAPSRQTNPVSKPQSKYVPVPLDVTVATLGPNFTGHDITAVVRAIKKSSALTSKSEFESTSTFSTRRAGFLDHPLYGNVRPSNYLGFVVDNDATEFKYDADSQILTVTLTGGTEHFVLEEDEPTLDSVLIRRIVLSSDRYLGGNAFGAKVTVTRTTSEEYGVAFNQNSWLFPEENSQTFKYLIAMGPLEARAMKASAKLLLVCRLSDPWFRHGAHGINPTINNPTETNVGENYLQVSPEQLWLFNQKTGEIIRKLSESSIASDKDHQLTLKVRQGQTPLILEVEAGSQTESVLINIKIDEAPEQLDNLYGRPKTFTAERKIILETMSSLDVADLRFTLNGKPYSPNWIKDSTRIGSYLVITVP